MRALREVGLSKSALGKSALGEDDGVLWGRRRRRRSCGFFCKKARRVKAWAKKKKDRAVRWAKKKAAKVKEKLGKAKKWAVEKATKAKAKLKALANKLKKLFKKALIKAGYKLMQKFMPGIIMKIAKLSKAQYGCLCSGYLGQVVDPRFGWAVAPSWKTEDQPEPTPTNVQKTAQAPLYE